MLRSCNLLTALTHAIAFEGPAVKLLRSPFDLRHSRALVAALKHACHLEVRHLCAQSRSSVRGGAAVICLAQQRACRATKSGPMYANNALMHELFMPLCDQCGVLGSILRICRHAGHLSLPPPRVMRRALWPHSHSHPPPPLQSWLHKQRAAPPRCRQHPCWPCWRGRAGSRPHRAPRWSCVARDALSTSCCSLHGASHTSQGARGERDRSQHAVCGCFAALRCEQQPFFGGSNVTRSSSSSPTA